MNSVLSETAPTDFSFSQGLLVIGDSFAPCQLNDAYESLHHDQGVPFPNLDWQPTTSSAQETDFVMIGALHLMADQTILGTGASPDLHLPFSVLDMNVDDALMGRPIPQTKKTSSLKLNIGPKAITKHHRRNNACLSLDEVLQCTMVASMLMEYQRNPLTD